MKTLQVLCFEFIGVNFKNHRINCAYLPNKYKELLLEWLISHNRPTQNIVDIIQLDNFLESFRTIKFYKSEQITDSILFNISASKCKLHNILIHGCNEVSDKGIANLLATQTELKSLILRKLKKFTGSSLSKIKSSSLDIVDLRGCSHLNPSGLANLLSSCRVIKSLVLCDCKLLDESIFCQIAECLGKTLEELDLTQLHFVKDEGLLLLAEKCPNLTKINLSGCSSVTEKGLSKVLTSCSSLSSLDLSYCFGLQGSVSSQCLLLLPVTVQELSFCGVRLENKQLFCSALTRLSHLKRVKLSGVPALCDDTLEEILSVIGRHLIELDLNGSVTSSITDTGLASIVMYCHNMQVLSLGQLPHITGSSLLPLFTDVQRASQFTILFLSFPQASKSLITEVCHNCHNLEILNLSALSFIDNFLLMTIAENCPLMSQLYLKGCKEVSDAGVVELAKLSNLTMLSLSGIVQLTDRSVFELARTCHNLKELYLNGCERITEAALYYLADCCTNRLYVENLVPHADPFLVMGRNLDTGEFCRLDNSPFTTYSS